VKPTAIALLIALLACPAFSDATARGWLCIEPLGVKLCKQIYTLRLRKLVTSS
jgi:hypothetical protein